MPTREQIRAVFDIDAAYRGRLEALTPDEMVQYLNGLPADGRRFILNTLGLGAARQVTRAAATQLIARLAAGGSRRAELTAPLFSPLVWAFGADLSAQEWAAFAGPDPIASMQIMRANGDALALAMTRRPSEQATIDALSLVSAVDAGLPGSAIALAFLAGRDPVAAAAYELLREDYPTLPAPIVPDDVTPMRRVTNAGHEWPTGAERSRDLTVATLDHVLAAANPPEPLLGGGILDKIDAGVPDAPRVGLQLILRVWDQMRDDLLDQVQELDAGHLPDGEVATSFGQFTTLARKVAAALELADDGGFHAAATAWLERRDHNPARAWLLRLAAMEGPAELADEIDAVSDLARTAASQTQHDLDEALSALLALIDLAAIDARGASADIDALFRAQETAREGLPQYQRLIYSASKGSLVVPKPEEDQPGPTDDSTSPAHHDAPTPAPVPDTQAADVTPEHDLPTHVDDSAPDAPEPAVQTDSEDETANEDETTGPSAGAPARASDPAAGTDASIPELASEADRARSLTATEINALREAIGGAMRRHTSSVPAAPTTPPAPETTEHSDAPTDVATIPEPNGEDAPIPAWASPTIRNLDRRLVAAGRYGMAADVAELTGAPQASVAARQVGAYAQNVHSATGDMAVAFSERGAHIVLEDLRDDRVGQLLAWGAAAKMAVLAPPAGPADALINLTPCIDSSPALAEVGDALKEAARNGVVLVAPEAVKAAGALATAQAEVRELSTQAEVLLTTSRHRTIKYIPANEIYQRWLAPDQALGAALAAVRDNDTTKVTDVSRAVIDTLRGKGEKNIVTVFNTLQHRSTKTITAGPRMQLLERWDSAVELCAQWVTAREQQSALEEATRNNDWQSVALARLRAQIEPHREAALTDLTESELQEGIAGDNGPSALLTDAFAACDGGVPPGSEPTRAFAEHSELLALPVELNRATLTIANAGEHITDVLDLATAPELSADDVYTLLAARAAHDLTDILVTGTRTLDPSDGARLEARRNRDLPAVNLQVQEEVAALRSHVDIRRLAGALSDQMWSAVSARVAQLDDPERRDYETIRAHIADIRAELDVERTERVAETRERIATAVAEHQNVAAHQDTLLALCEAGELATADEQLQQAIEGSAALERDTNPEHLTRFFPAVPKIVSATPNAIIQVASHLRDQVDSPVTQRLADNGIDLFSLSPARVKQADLAVAAWRRLTSKSTVPAMPDIDAIGHILRQAGLEFASHTTDKGSNRNKQWVTLNKVRGLGRPLTPTLGSGMSPGESFSLRLLLVRQAVTPSTVIEWMSGEPGDRTVLALWLQDTALTPAEWRAIGEASRGRKQPPVVFLDLGALLYLCAQAEPRLTTLASIALPFTSANPYRDTPGEAAPEMFYGRTSERSEILDMRGSSFVSGGRQLGKTTLLQDAARRFEKLSPEHHVAVLTSIFRVGKVNDGIPDPPERVWNYLWPELATRGVVPTDPPNVNDLGPVVHNHVKAWLAADDRRQLLILLDEADDFLDADAQHARFVNVGQFRDLMLQSGRRVKFVLAGLHRTARFESWPNQPLSHLGRPIVVGPLRPQHAYDLLTEPMAAMGYTFDDRITVARALAYANNMPSQLQLLGGALVDHMSRKPLDAGSPPMVITADDVDDAFDQRLQAVFREKFTLTLNLDPRYKVIAYVVAHAAHERGVDASLTLSELSDECRAAWPEGFSTVSNDLFRGLVSECVDLGVLAQDGTRLRLRTPTVRRLLGTDVEVFEELAAAPDTLVIPSISDGGAYRARVDNQPSALTDRQVGALLKHEPAVTVIAGSNATCLARVMTSLEHTDSSDRPDLTVTQCTSVRELPLAAAISKAVGRTWLLVDARTMTAPELDRVLRSAQEATDRTRQPVRTIVVAGPTSAAAWAGWANRIDLSRYDAQGLTMHADENNLPYHEPTKVAQLLTATGGWPHLVAKVTAALRDQSSRPDGQSALAHLTATLEAEPGELATLVGVDPRTQGALALTLQEAIRFTETTAEPLDLLAELIDADADDHIKRELTTAGFPSAKPALTALVALGALVPTSDGTLAAEPVLRRDVQLAAAQ